MAKKVAKEDAPKRARVRAPREDLGALQVHLYDTSGAPVGVVDLPPVFGGDVRVDLIRRAVIAFQANRRQPYAAKFRAGQRHSVRWPGKGQGAARTPRIRGTMIGAQSPNTVGGRQAFPPSTQRIWAKKVNVKERRLARNAALAAIRDGHIVSARGHRFSEKISVPIVVQDALEEIESTSEAVELFEALGVHEDLQRTKDGTHIRAGRGKMRGRRYRVPKGPLLVVRNATQVRQGFGNLPGVDVTTPSGLNAEVLAPGGNPGRLTIFSASALEALRGW
ncbi:MAG: 50S ribosomal protein L4 [Thermoplasmata archaeon]